MAEVYIALGSNLGERAQNLARARSELAARGIVPERASSVYETEPWGPVPQGKYLNQVLRANTAIGPKELLATLRLIETRIGRDRGGEVRYGPRVIDLDILLYDELVMHDPELQIPHPRMLERAFVLAPLAEIAPNISVAGVPVRQALAGLDASGVVRLADTP